MIARVIAVLAVILIGGGMLAPCNAQSADKTGHYNKIGPAEMIAALADIGVAVVPYTKRTDDTPELMGTVDGLNYSILFYRCDKKAGPHCTVYQYWTKFTGLSITAENLNEWNRETWLATANLGADGAVRLVLTQRVEGGTTKANIAGAMADWREALKKFTGHIGFNKPAS
jgi:hypothetical protein